MILDAIVLPFFWLLLFSIVSTIGFVFLPFKCQSGVLYKSIFTWFWYGMGILVAFLQIWNLFLPVTIITVCCVIPFSIYGGIKILRERQLISIERISYPTVILFILVLCFLVISELSNGFIYDSMVYHFYSIKWANQYKVIPGMGNLYIYLNNNQSYFIFSAFLNGIWGNYKGACATNGLLALVISSELILYNAKYFFQKEKMQFSTTFQLLFLPLCIVAGAQSLSSPTPDVFVNLLTFKILSDVIKYLEAKKVNFQDIFILTFYCVLGVVMKLSFIGVALGVSVLVIFWLFSEKLWKGIDIIKAFSWLLLLIIPWVFRGIISSGYIGFPITAFGFPVDWKVPKGQVVEFAAYVKGFARTHLHGTEAIAAANNYTWVTDWIKRMLTNHGFILPFLSFLIASALIKIKGMKLSTFKLIYVPIFFSIVVFLITAPDVRFAAFTFWALGLVPLAYVISQLSAKWIKGFIIVIFICSILIMARNWNPVIVPLADLPKHDYTIFTTKSGLKINTIKKTSPSFDDWSTNDCDIPCSFLPDSNLILRGKTMEDGFRIVK